MDKKVFLAVALCAGIFLLWNQYYIKPYTERHQAWVQQHETQKEQQNQAQATPSAEQTPESKTPGVVSKKAAKSTLEKGNAANAPQTLALGTSAYQVTLNTKGGVISSINIPEYRGQKTTHVATLIADDEQLALSTPSPEWDYLSSVNYTVQKHEKTPEGDDHVVLSYEDPNVSILRTYTVHPAGFYLDHDVSMQFRKTSPSYVYLGLKAYKKLPKSQTENEKRQLILNRVGGQDTFTVSDIDELKENQAPANWFAFSARYFINALSNRSVGEHPQFQARPSGDNQVAAGFFYKVQGNSVQVPVRYYYGPKEIEVLKAAGNHLDAAVDFGWFTIFAYPMLKALKWIYGYVHNFGIAIIILTVLIKLLMYPLTLKSMTSMKQMQRIQPQIQRLREKYKDDKEKLNRETLQLMRANGSNPMSGCLPMFIQMPIFIALYNVLYGAIDLYGQPFFGWIHDLSAKDPLYVTPALMAIMMFLQQKLTPSTAADPSQQRMMMMLPVAFGVMMLWLPSGLTLYMLVNSVTSIVQQLAINRKMNLGAPAAA